MSSTAREAQKVCYVLMDFPIPSERFIDREIRALRLLKTSIQVATLQARKRHNSKNGFRILRPAPWWAPRVWVTLVLAWNARAADVTRLVGLAWAAGASRALWRRLAALRWVLVVLTLAPEIRREQPDLIHAHFASAPTTVALLLAHWLNLPWGFSCHASDIYAERVGLRFKTQRASHLVACSEKLSEDIRARIPSAQHNKVHSVHHGLDFERWKANGPLPRLAASDPLILGIGRLEPKKGFAVLVDACALLRDDRFRFHCELIGTGQEAEELARQVRDAELGPRVERLPWRSPQGVRQALARASVLVVPSIVSDDGDRDNIPNVILEALACGVPVVASALPAIERILKPSGAGYLVTPGDPVALAAAIREVCSDRELAQRLRHNGKALVQDHFEHLANAQRLKDIFLRSILEGATI